MICRADSKQRCAKLRGEIVIQRDGATGRIMSPDVPMRVTMTARGRIQSLAPGVLDLAVNLLHMIYPPEPGAGVTLHLACDESESVSVTTAQLYRGFARHLMRSCHRVGREQWSLPVNKVRDWVAGELTMIGAEWRVVTT